MKKLITLVIALVIGMSSMAYAGCAKKTDFTVGIVQLIAHEALDASNRGFKEELTKLLKAEGKTVSFDDNEAAGEFSNCTTIAETLVSKNVDIILAIATPAAQAVANVTETVPVLFTAVTDAEDAGLVDTNEAPNGNVSGTSDLNPVSQQIDLIKKLVPNISKIAVLYNTGERNSEIQVELAQAKCDELGIGLVDKGITALAELELTMTSIASDVGAIYIPTDNLLASSAPNVHTTNMSNNKLPIVCGETGMNDKCGVATYGINYYELGKQTAHMAFKILMENADISKMAVEYQSGEPALSINSVVADEIDFDIPQAVLDLASN